MGATSGATATAMGVLSSSEILSMLKKGPTSSSTGTLKGELVGTVLGGSATETMAAKVRPTDDYRMMGLAEVIKRAHADRNSLALGIDSEAVITAMSTIPETGGNPGETVGGVLSASPDSNSSPLMLSKLLSSPWAEIGLPLRRNVAAGVGHHPLAPNSLEAILPVCYNVQAPPPAATRIGAFTEETLFYMFYGMPRDRMQDMAARELTLARGWRYHKELRLWVLPASVTPTASSMTAGISALRMSPAPSSTVTTAGIVSPALKGSPNLEGATTASYIIFDPNTWSKMRRELPVLREEQLEDRFASGNTGPSATGSTVVSPK